MRLTEELPMGSYRAKTIYLEPGRNEQECVYKLGQLEDIEDKHNVLSLDDLDNRLTAFELIKKCFNLNGFDELIPNDNWWKSETIQEFIREILDKRNLKQ